MQSFGLIGYPLSHSFSKKYFDEKFAKEGWHDIVFNNYSIEHIDLLHEVLQNKNLLGLAVTIPYKKSVIPLLNGVDALVREIEACNCIKIYDGKLFGFNTDIIGFEESFVRNLLPQHKQALILGTGGAAAAVEFVLKKLNIKYQFVSRNTISNALMYSDLNEEMMNENQIIINTSPVGTYPNVDESPAIPYQFITPQHYLFDLIYNPAETKFLQEGKLKGAVIKNGYEMLVLQAEENWKIWNS